MKGSLVALTFLILLVTPGALAQSSSDDGVAARSPSENVQNGAVRERAPARLIDFARSRHAELRDLRLAAQRSGDHSELAPELESSGSSGTSFSDLLGGSLTSVLNTFLGSGLSGSLTPLTGQGGSTSGSGGNDFSNLPPEVLQMLAGAGINLSDLTQKSVQKADDGSSKTDSRSQTTIPQPTETSFRVRWADAMLSTFFSALTVGFQTSDFIDLLKDFIRPVIFPDNADSGDGAQNGGDQNNSGNGNDGEPII